MLKPLGSQFSARLIKNFKTGCDDGAQLVFRQWAVKGNLDGCADYLEVGNDFLGPLTQSATTVDADVISPSGYEKRHFVLIPETDDAVRNYGLGVRNRGDCQIVHLLQKLALPCRLSG